MGFKMPTNAAFTSMPNSEGVIVGGRGQNRGHNGLSQRGYPLELGLSTAQVYYAIRLHI